MAAKYDEDMLDRAARMLAQAIPERVIVARLAKEHARDRKTVARYVAEVRRRWDADAANASPDEWRTRLTNMALDRYRVACEKGHQTTALRCIDTIARIQGVTASQVNSIVNLYNRGSASLGQAITDEVRKLQQLAAGTDEDKGSGSAN